MAWFWELGIGQAVGWVGWLLLALALALACNASTKETSRKERQEGGRCA